MENIFQTDEVWVDRGLMERTNPGLNTAKMTLFMLAAAGDADARQLVQKLELTREETQNSDTVLADDDLILGGTLVVETRYRVMERLAEESGCDTIVDLPCGYTPRAIHFAEKEIPYIGLDLPAVVLEGGSVIMSMIEADKKRFACFRGVDATNYEALEEALKDAEGKVCIMTEGLMLYLTDSELAAMCDSIRKVLKKHGGCWITADPEEVAQYIVTMQSIIGTKFAAEMAKGKKVTEDKSGVTVGNGTLIIHPRQALESMVSAMQFLADHGLKAERINVGDHLPALDCMNKLTEDQRAALQKTLKYIAYWKITLADDIKVTEDGESQKFDIKAALSGEKLLLRLAGRMDSMTAPKLLAFYEQTTLTETIKEVLVDCKDLDYISSAGIRVLLFMEKKCERSVTLRAAKQAVMEILRQTGFVHIFRCED